jgi:hypothetical protein
MHYHYLAKVLLQVPLLSSLRYFRWIDVFLRLDWTSKLEQLAKPHRCLQHILTIYYLITKKKLNKSLYLKTYIFYFTIIKEYFKITTKK